MDEEVAELEKPAPQHDLFEVAELDGRRSPKWNRSVRSQKEVEEMPKPV